MRFHCARLNLWPVFLVAIIFLIATGPSVFAEPAASTNERQPLAFLNSFSGDVELTSQGVAVKPPKVGAALYSGDQLVTNSNAQAEIYAVEAGVLHLTGGSQLIISEATLPRSQLSERIFRLIKGKCRGVFGKLKKPVRVETPTAVAGIRGTRLMLDAERKLVVLFEGEIAVSPVGSTKQQSVGLGSGDYLGVGAGSSWRAKPLDFSELIREDRNFDFGITAKQVPYVTTHQQWAAWVARELDYELPKGWSTYPASAYLDLLSPSGNSEITVDSYSTTADNNPLKLSQNKNGTVSLQASTKIPITVNYEIPIPADGEYELNAQLTGGQQYWSFETITTLLSPPSASMGGTSVGRLPLHKGIYQLSISLPPGGKLGSFKVEGPPTSGAAPQEGWMKDFVLTQAQMMVSLAKLMKLPNLETLVPTTGAVDYLALSAQLKERGFVVGSVDAPVLGSDALINIALLHGPEKKLPQKNRKQKSKQHELEDLRSPVSPIVPSNP